MMPESLKFYDFREKLRNLFGVEQIKIQIVLDKIKEEPSVIIPE